MSVRLGEGQAEQSDTVTKSQETRNRVMPKSQQRGTKLATSQQTAEIASRSGQPVPVGSSTARLPSRRLVPHLPGTLGGRGAASIGATAASVVLSRLELLATLRAEGELQRVASLLSGSPDIRCGPKVYLEPPKLSKAAFTVGKGALEALCIVALLRLLVGYRTVLCGGFTGHISGGRVACCYSGMLTVDKTGRSALGIAECTY